MMVSAALLQPSFVQAQESVSVSYGSDAVSDNISGKARLHIRSRSGSETVQVPAGFQSAVFASQLGSISATTMDESGALYIADQKLGRIVKLADRARDGKLDATRIVLRGLDRPSGIAVIGDYIFIADAEAIWKAPLSGGAMKKLASLANAEAAPFPRPLLSVMSGQFLYLGLTSTGSPAAGRVISIDTETGQAGLVASGEGSVTAFGRSGASTVWVGAGNKLAPIIQGGFDVSKGTDIEATNSITGMVLPGQFTDQHEAFAPFQDHILVSQGGTLQWGRSDMEGLNILAVPSRFGLPAEGRSIFAKGFAARSGRSAWGEPGAMLMDKRGLFVADALSGTIWLVSAAPPERVKPVDEGEEAATSEEKLVAEDGPKNANPQGSLILKGSQIERGSMIEIGSTIIEKADEEEALKENEAAKKSRKPSARPEK